MQTVSAAAIPAGTPVATVLKVEGELDILVSAESGLVRAEQGIVLKEGTRVITMAKTNVTIKFSDGCVIELKPNHRFEVSMAPPCEERIELAESTLIDVAELEAILESSTASIPAMALSGAFPGGVIAGTGLAGAGAIAAASAQDTASPN